MRAAVAPGLLVAVLALGACAPTHDKIRVRAPDGSLRWEYETVNGVPHGLSRTYHPSGTVASEARYVAGRRHGPFVEFDERGRKVRYVVYQHGEVISTSSDGRRASTVAATIEYRRADIASLFDGDRQPRPYFSSVDRTTSLTRFGLQVGVSGDSDVGFGAARRAEVFANYQLTTYGVYAQLAGSQLAMAGDTAAGRRTLELGATYRRRLYRGDLTPRVGLVVPVGRDGVAGFVPAATSSFQRPTDAATATTSTLALRTGTSWTRSLARVALQADAGLDWLAGGAGGFDALARANAAVGYGSQNAMLSLELSNTLRLSDPAERIHALGVGGTIWLRGFWVTAFWSRTTSAQNVLTGTVGYGF